jgi:hypothetical protein
MGAEQAADRTVVNGQQIPLVFAPTTPAGWDPSSFTLTEFGLAETVTVIQTTTSTFTPTTTITVVVEPTKQAKCASWITAFSFWTFEVYGIDGWATDGGAKLKSEEKGCGALTGWEWDEATPSTYSRAYFNLPFIMKSGCVERAIVSAGGPKVSCEFQGYDVGVGFLLEKRSLRIEAPPLAKSKVVKREKVEPQMGKRQRNSPTPELPSRSSYTTFTYSTSPATYATEPWGPGNTVTLTTTVESLSSSTYTTEIVLANFIGSSTSSSATPSGSLSPSTNGRCGPDFAGTTCLGTTYGNCCSIYGWCGSTSDTCANSVCDPLHGTCDPPPSGPLVSQDGACGGNGRTCAGSTFGGCCSQYGYCGDASGFCGTGCQTGFGTCGMSGPPVSTDGTCSSASNPVGATCASSGFGNCCSEYGYCGASNAYCGTGCQSAFGTCP